MRIDHELTKIIDKLQDDDLLIVTGNFGNDPTYPGEKHTREYVPLLVTSPQIKPNISLGGRSFSDIGATILDNYDLGDKLPVGNSFLRELFSDIDKRGWKNSDFPSSFINVFRPG